MESIVSNLVDAPVNKNKRQHSKRVQHDHTFGRLFSVIHMYVHVCMCVYTCMYACMCNIYVYATGVATCSFTNKCMTVQLS